MSRRSYRFAFENAASKSTRIYFANYTAGIISEWTPVRSLFTQWEHIRLFTIESSLHYLFYFINRLWFCCKQQTEKSSISTQLYKEYGLQLSGLYSLWQRVEYLLYLFQFGEQFILWVRTKDASLLVDQTYLLFRFQVLCIFTFQRKL